jgi:hypothetical protein
LIYLSSTQIKASLGRPLAPGKTQAGTGVTISYEEQQHCRREYQRTRQRNQRTPVKTQELETVNWQQQVQRWNFHRMAQAMEEQALETNSTTEDGYALKAIGHSSR